MYNVDSMFEFADRLYLGHRHFGWCS